MSDAGKAVFLSYASQDAEAAKRICDALRAAGVEVWFDQSELVGGDAWDAKIRKQIKECALLIPIISANTQSRTEGYFRLEWRLADQRTHLMAKGRAFLLPVVIDDTRDTEAHVPDSFTEVQWTRLPGGEAPEKFCARVKKLLGGSDLEAGRPRPAERGEGAASPRKQVGRWWWALPIFGMAMALLLVMKEARKEPAPAGASPPVSEADQLVRQARELTYDPDSARNEFALAASLLKRATDLAPASGPAWGASALLNHYFFSRAYDTDRQRLVRSQAEADQALRLDPRNPDALLALGLHRQELGELDRARDYFDRARAIDPDNSKVVLAQGFQLPDPRARAKYLLDAAPTVTRAAELYYYAGINLRWARQYEAARGAIDQAIAARPFWRAYVMRADMEYMITADPEKIDAWLDKVPEAKFDEPRVAYMRYHAARLRRDGAGMAHALRGIAADYLQDSFFIGPKAYLLAQAYTFAGQPGPALEQWQIAERSVREKLAAEPNVINWRAMLAVILAGQQRMAEAKAAADALAADERSGQSQDLRGMGVLTAEIVAHAYMAVGEPAQAIAVLRRPRPVIYTGDVSAASLAADPAYDSLRGLPEYAELLAELKRGENAAPAGEADRPAVSAAKVDDKSVAVLAFENFSDDKANDYFSDGISEELLNVLAKISGLKVTARTSSFFFKGKEVPVPEIAKQLGVAYVVEGSVRKQGDRVRITAQLIKAADGFHVWSDTFTRDLKDVFAVQDEIAGLIAHNLQLKLDAAQRVTASVDPEAYRLYLQGRQALLRRTNEGFDQAEKLFRQAQAIAPNWAETFAGMADAERLRGAFNDDAPTGPDAPWSQGLRNAKAAAERAVALDPNLPEAYVALAGTYEAGWNLAEADRQINRALELNPNQADAYLVLGRVRSAQGRMDETIAAFQRAAELNPLAPRILDNLAAQLGFANRYAEGWAVIERASALQPDSSQIQCYRARLLSQLGRREEALQQARQLADNPNPEDRNFRLLEAAGVHLAFGERAEAEALAEKITPGAPEQAIACAYLGRPEAALPLLDRINFSWVDDLLWGRGFEPIRSDPRYQAYLKKVGLTEAGARAQAWRAAHPEAKK